MIAPTPGTPDLTGAPWLMSMRPPLRGCTLGCRATLGHDTRWWNRARRSRTLRRARWGCWPGRGIIACRPAFFLGGQRNDSAVDPRHRLDDTLGGGTQRFEFLRSRGRHGDREEHLVVGDENIRNQPELDNVAVEVRTSHRLQLLEHLLLRHACHSKFHPCHSFQLK